MNKIKFLFWSWRANKLLEAEEVDIDAFNAIIDKLRRIRKHGK